MDEKPLNNGTPDWFKDWHRDHYRPFRMEFHFYKKICWVIFVAIVGSIIISVCRW